MLFHFKLSAVLRLIIFSIGISSVLAMLSPLSAFCSTQSEDMLLGMSADERGFTAENSPNIDASFAAVIDQDGTLVFGRQATKPAQIASLTKIMTALVAVEYLSSDTTITITPTAANVGEANAGLAQGDSMTFNTALKALLTASGNNVATAIAEAAGTIILNQQGQSGNASACEAAFIQAMNDKAGELELKNSYFTNAHGLDFGIYAQGQYSCAQDVAFVLRAAMEHELIGQNIAHSQVNISVNRAGASSTISLEGKGRTILDDYAGACAVKTGFTQAAGPCLASAVQRTDAPEYYTVVLNSSSKPQRFVDSTTLYDWVYANRSTLEQADEERQRAEEFAAEEQHRAEEEAARRAQYATYQLFTSPDSIQATINHTDEHYPVVAYVAHSEWVDKRITATVQEPHKALEIIKEEGPLTQEVSYNTIFGAINCGETIGHLKFLQGDTVVWETDLLAAESVTTPSWLDAVGIAMQRFIGGFFGWQSIAQSELINPAPLKIS